MDPRFSISLCYLCFWTDSLTSTLKTSPQLKGDRLGAIKYVTKQQQLVPVGLKFLSLKYIDTDSRMAHNVCGGGTGRSTLVVEWVPFDEYI